MTIPEGMALLVIAFVTVYWAVRLGVRDGNRAARHGDEDAQQPPD